MLRYVILEHDYPELHWDLMLETGEVLRTWRLAQPPRPGQTVAATASFDHRRLYLDYEGPISGNRGQVKRWDAGVYSGELSGQDRYVLCFQGKCLRGMALLSQSAGQWSLQYSVFSVQCSVFSELNTEH